MLICAMELTVRLTDAQSLKDKRQTAKSLIARLQRRFGISAAEVDLQDDHKTLVVGMAVVTGSRRQGEQVLENALGFAEEELIGRGEVIAVDRQLR